jgi:hypothetical protein
MTHRTAWAACVVAAAMTLGGAARAGKTNAEKCELKRIQAATKYASCVQKVLTLTLGSGSGDALYGKCRRKYGAKFQKLQRLAGSPCAFPRWVDNGDGTITDNLSALQWELKTTDATTHDVDNSYVWSSTVSASDGPLFATFLKDLNNSCFAGQCDWRVPTAAELGTLLLPEPYPCGSSPCVDPLVGLVNTDSCYWSSTSAFQAPESAFDVCFSDGKIRANPKSLPARVFGVRGGL